MQFPIFSSEKSLILNLRNLFAQKERSDKKQEIVVKQLHLLQDLESKSLNTDKHLFSEIESFFNPEIQKALKLLEDFQKEILIESLKNEMNNVKAKVTVLIQVYNAQLSALRAEDKSEKEKFQSLVYQEKTKLDELMELIREDTELQNAIKKATELAAKLSHKRWFLNLLRSNVKIIMFRGRKIVVETKYQIPLTEPVLFAARHFDGDLDPSLMYATIPRRVFFLGATDFMKKDIVGKSMFMIYKWLGVAPVFRKDTTYLGGNGINANEDYGSQILNYLMLNQAVVIFPEQWPIKDSHYSPREKESRNSIGTIRPGIFILAKEFQSARGKPVQIIPIGINYKTDLDKTIVVNFGEPIYLKVTGNDSDDRRHMLEQIKNLGQILKELSA